MSYKQFPFRSSFQFGAFDTIEKRIYEKFITEISGLIVDAYDWTLVRFYRDDEVIFQNEVVFEWSWNENNCLSDLSSDLNNVLYDEVEECGEGYYLGIIDIEGEYIENSLEMEYMKTISDFVKFISIDEIEKGAL